MIPRLAAAAVLLALSGTACHDLGPTADTILDDIALHRTLWESKRPSAYVFELKRVCSCPETEQGPVRIRVQGNTVVERTFTSSQAPVPPSLHAAFPSIEGLFDLLTDAAKRDPWYINMNWDPELAYPRDLYVDYDSRVINDEVSYQVVTAPVADPGS